MGQNIRDKTDQMDQMDQTNKPDIMIQPEQTNLMIQPEQTNLMIRPEQTNLMIRPVQIEQSNFFNLTLINPSDLVYLSTSERDYYYDELRFNVCSLYDKQEKKYFSKSGSIKDIYFIKELLLTKLLSSKGSVSFDAFNKFINKLSIKSTETSTDKPSIKSIFKPIDNIKLDEIDKFDSDQIVTFAEFVIDARIKKLYLITESNGLDFFDFLDSLSDNKLDEAECKIFFKEMVKILAQLHKIGIAHGDISIENFCIDIDDKIRLIDFEMALISPTSKYYRLINNNLQTKYIEIVTDTVTDTTTDIICKISSFKTVGKRAFVSPERQHANTDNSKSYSAYKDDIFSMGVILFSMLTGHTLFDNNISLEKKLDMINNDLWLEKYDKTILGDISDECKDLMKNILKPETNRYNLDQIMNHPWLDLV